MTTTLTIRNREDVLAVASVVLGFKPDRSIVMLTFGARPFHARVDAPANQQDLDEVVEALLNPVLQHGSEMVVFALYDMPWEPEHVARTLKERFAKHVHVGDVVLATQTEYQAADGTWVAYDTDTNTLNTQAVADGRIVRRSREELTRMLEPGPTTLTTIDRAPDPTDNVFMRSVTDTLSVLDDDDLARFVANLDNEELRDIATLSLTRKRAHEQVDFWTDVVIRTPLAHRAHPTAALALTAWLKGDGALAWCALDSSPKTSGLGDLVAHVLTDAVPPTSWDDFIKTTSG